jgi:hypothetical protein
MEYIEKIVGDSAEHHKKAGTCLISKIALNGLTFCAGTSSHETCPGEQHSYSKKILNKPQSYLKYV